MTLKVLGLLAVVIAGAYGHTYHLGACPTVEPMHGFEMNKVIVIFLLLDSIGFNTMGQVQIACLRNQLVS